MPVIIADWLLQAPIVLQIVALPACPSTYSAARERNQCPGHLPSWRGNHQRGRLAATDVPGTRGPTDGGPMCPATRQERPSRMAPRLTRRHRRIAGLRDRHERCPRVGHGGAARHRHAHHEDLADLRRSACPDPGLGQRQSPASATAGRLSAESGRGLLLVQTLSAEWGYYTPEGQEGKIVWVLCMDGDVQVRGPRHPPDPTMDTRR